MAIGGTKHWPGAQWQTASRFGAETAFTFRTDSYLVADERGVFYFKAYAPPAKLGKGAMYFSAYRDADGQPMTGDDRYRLRIPAGVPASQFWSATVYDTESFAFVRESPCSRSTPTPKD